jgi:PqqA peptide cyclase
MSTPLEHTPPDSTIPCGTPSVSPVPRLLTLVAELTYSCPLRCAYCSNPVGVNQSAKLLSTGDWLRVIDQAEQLGALQIHFTGGEPLLFKDLEMLVRRAREKQLYTNLITSGTPLCQERLEGLRSAGLDHVQLSLQAVTRERNLRIAGIDASQQKLQVAHWVKALGLALTVNIVVHRENIPELPQLIALAETLEPHRIELANAQYLGWALLNREHLLPSASELEVARQLAQAAQSRLRGKIDVLSVLPDYYANRPRACMQGWARAYAVVTPDGLVLPCHAARDLPGITYDNVRASALSAIWATSEALRRFRGDDWYPEPCRGCADRTKDFGGCRCQALALTGDETAADPACSQSPSHSLVQLARARAEQPPSAAALILRRAPVHHAKN